MYPNPVNENRDCWRDVCDGDGDCRYRMAVDIWFESYWSSVFSEPVEQIVARLQRSEEFEREGIHDGKWGQRAKVDRFAASGWGRLFVFQHFHRRDHEVTKECQDVGVVPEGDKPRNSRMGTKERGELWTDSLEICFREISRISWFSCCFR